MKRRTEIVCLSLAAALLMLACSGPSTQAPKDTQDYTPTEFVSRRIPGSLGLAKDADWSKATDRCVIDGTLEVRLDRVLVGAKSVRVDLGLKNLSGTKVVTSRGWSTEGSGYNEAALCDEHLNGIQAWVMTLGEPLAKSMLKDQSIPPGGSATDTLVFDLLPNTSKEIRLVLPGRAVGLSGDGFLRKFRSSP